MDVHGIIPTTEITILKLTILVIKGIWLITLGESVAVYKNIYTAHIIIIGIKILSIESIVVHRKIPTTHVTHF